MKTQPPALGADPERARLEAELAQALAFLGHGAREGHASLLALIELKRVRTEPMTMTEFVERVESTARKSLRSIDDFVDLALARTQPLRIEKTNLVDLVGEAIGESRIPAARRGIDLQRASMPNTANAWVDRELIGMAINRLLGDAVEGAPVGARIDLTLRHDDVDWSIEIDAPVAALPNASGDPGTRAIGKRSSVYAGVTLASAIAARHDGSAEARMNEDAGRTVRIGAPLTRARRTPEAT